MSLQNARSSLKKLKEEKSERGTWFKYYKERGYTDAEARTMAGRAIMKQKIAGGLHKFANAADNHFRNMARNMEANDNGGGMLGSGLMGGGYSQSRRKKSKRSSGGNDGILGMMSGGRY